MKNRNRLIVGVLALGLVPVFAQQPQPAHPPGAQFSERLATIVNRAPGDAASAPVLTKFSLDFPGGTPHQLASVIEKAMGKPLNVIIADEQANMKLPPLKMTDVTVPQLFAALLKVSCKYDAGHNLIGSYGFETDTDKPSEDSIWRFFVYNASQPQTLTRFDLDFPGGTPKQLVMTIEKATGKPLNVVIPAENADVQLPALKMNDVNVQELFRALTSASQKTIAVTMGRFPNAYQQMVTSYGFRTEGTITDASIWYFYVDRPSLPPVVSTSKVSRFYSLAPYLDRNLSVDDITTAIQTAWKMLGERETPTISFHKETKLLIAVGEPDKLETIDSVLQALQPPPEKGTSNSPATAEPSKSAEKAKAGN